MGEKDQVSEPPTWPSVVVVVPARNEAAMLPRTLPALLAQDHAASYAVLIVDDRSEDGTAQVAERVAAEAGQANCLGIIRITELPQGWLGKPHAMEQGFREALRRGAELVLFTDADILHAPGSLRRLVSTALTHRAVLESRMARLSCSSGAERLLIPAFVWFFGLLYPMRRVNDPSCETAAAAGGCMLVDARALHEAGGFGSIRDRVIDDVSLARLLKDRGGRIHLALSRSDVVSLREYAELGDIWRMVRRTAFTELRHSWLRLAACLAGLALLFVAPPLALVIGAVALLAGHVEPATLAALHVGAAAWVLLALLYVPALRFFRLPVWRSFTLPFAAALYGAMTFDSALVHARGSSEPWRDVKQEGPSRSPAP